MSQIVGTVEEVLARAPRWIRQDLMSTDATVRTRAEETLAAMISVALQDSNDSEDDEPLASAS